MSRRRRSSKEKAPTFEPARTTADLNARKGPPLQTMPSSAGLQLTTLGGSGRPGSVAHYTDAVAQQKETEVYGDLVRERAVAAYPLNQVSRLLEDAQWLDSVVSAAKACGDYDVASGAKKAELSRFVTHVARANGRTSGENEDLRAKVVVAEKEREFWRGKTKKVSAALESKEDETQCLSALINDLEDCNLRCFKAEFHLSSVAQEKARQIQALQSSMSWKVTRSLRSLLQIASRMKGMIISDAEVRHHFNRSWYIESYPDVIHGEVEPYIDFLQYGTLGDCSPNPYFDCRWYLECNEDVRQASINPLVHFIHNGMREGRRPHPTISNTDYLCLHPLRRRQK